MKVKLQISGKKGKDRWHDLFVDDDATQKDILALAEQDGILTDSILEIWRVLPVKVVVGKGVRVDVRMVRKVKGVESRKTVFVWANNPKEAYEKAESQNPGWVAQPL